MMVGHGPIYEGQSIKVDLRRIPAPVHALEDGGPYFDAGVVIARDPDTGVRNASIQRFMVTGKDRMHINIDAGRHLDSQGLDLSNPPAPGTFAALRRTDRTLTTTGGTRLLNRKESLLDTNLSAAAAPVAGGALRARLGSRAAAPAAFHLGGYFDVDGVARNGLLQRQGQLVPQVGPAENPAAPAAAGIAENIAENITEYVAECIPAGTKTAAGLTGVHTGVTELIVCGALLRIGEDFVGFLGFLEAGFGLFVVGIAVRMVFHGQTPVSLLQFGFPGVSAASQDFIVIPLGHAPPFQGPLWRIMRCACLRRCP